MRLLAFLLVLLLLPFASGHSAPAILDVEVRAIADEANNATHAMDGYDLHSLHLRAAHSRQAGSDGLVFRIIAAGGAVTPVAGEHAIEFDVSIDGDASTYRFTTTDDATWQGDLDVVEQNNEDDGSVVLANFQAFLPTPLIALGATIDGFAMRSYADGQLVDAAPGGLYGPAGEIPNSGSSQISSGVTWAGPVGYTDTTFTRTTEGGTIDVANTISISGQHVTVRVGDAEGWAASIRGQLAASAEPGTDLSFQLIITAVGEGPLPIDILTDLGGREVITLPGQTDDPTQPLPQTPEDPDIAGEDSPGLPVALLLVALAGIAWRRR
jgi:hypothetical protein